METTTQYTRCPQCETAFKVSEKMLAMAQGKVRCGACLGVFQATEHILKPRQQQSAPVKATQVEETDVREADVEIEETSVEPLEQPLEQPVEQSVEDLQRQMQSQFQEEVPAAVPEQTAAEPQEDLQHATNTDELVPEVATESEQTAVSETENEELAQLTSAEAYLESLAEEQEKLDQQDTQVEDSEQTDIDANELESDTLDLNAEKLDAEDLDTEELEVSDFYDDDLDPDELDLGELEPQNMDAISLEVDESPINELEHDEFISDAQSVEDIELDDLEIDESNPDTLQKDGLAQEEIESIEEEQETQTLDFDDVDVNEPEFESLEPENLEPESLEPESLEADNKEADDRLEQAYLEPDIGSSHEQDWDLSDESDSEIDTNNNSDLSPEEELEADIFSESDIVSESMAVPVEEMGFDEKVTSDQLVLAEDEELELLSDNLSEQINETDPDPLEEFEGRVAKKKTTLRTLIILGSAIILFLVLAGNFWSKRQKLAYDSTWGGMTQGLCAVLPCNLQPRRSVAKIKLRQRIVTPSETDENKLDVKILLTNEARFAQPYPQITIKFSNSLGEQVAVKSFTVAEYFAEKQNQMMPAAAEVHIAFTTELPHPDALGFEFSFQ